MTPYELKKKHGVRPCVVGWQVPLLPHGDVMRGGGGRRDEGGGGGGLGMTAVIP